MMTPYPSTRFIRCLLWTVVMVSAGISADVGANAVLPDDGDAELFVKGSQQVNVYPATRISGSKQYDDHIKVKLHLGAKVWTLLGSPVYMCSGWWEIESVVVNYEKWRLGDIPQSVKNKLHIWDSTFRFNMVSFDGGAKLVCDAGEFGPPGKREASFNVPGSVGWDRIFEVSDAEAFVAGGSRADYAKQVLRNASKTPYRLLSIDVIQLKADLGPVYDWINGKEQLAVKQQAATVQEKKAQIPDDFDSLFGTVDAAKTVSQKQQQLQKSVTTADRDNQASARARAAQSQRLRQKDCSDAPLPRAAQGNIESFIDIQSQRLAKCMATVALTLKQDPQSRLWGYTNPQGSWHIPPTFPRARPFSAGLAAAQDKQQRWGYLNVMGEWQIAPQYESVDDFSVDSKQAIISTGKGKGVIDSQGKAVIAPQWEYLHAQGAHYIVQTQFERRDTRTERERDSHCGESFWKTRQFYRNHWREGVMSRSGTWVSALSAKSSDELENKPGITLSRSCY